MLISLAIQIRPVSCLPFFERNAGGETVDLLQLISAGIDQYKTMETAPSTESACGRSDAEEVTHQPEWGSELRLWPNFCTLKSLLR